MKKIVTAIIMGFVFMTTISQTNIKAESTAHMSNGHCYMKGHRGAVNNSYCNMSSSSNNVNNNHKKGWGHNKNGKWIWFTGKGQELYNKPGWQSWKGSWLFEKRDRTYATNEWRKIGSSWYNFNNNGYINKGWKYLGSHWYYFYNSGKMYTGKGWYKTKSGRWMYSKGTNGYATSEKYGKYKFDSNGYLK